MLSRRIAIMAALVLVALAVPTSALAQVKLVRAMSPEALPLYEMAAEMFERETGIDVEVFRAGTGDLTARIEAERTTGTIGADVLLAADAPTFEGYKAEGLLQQYSPADVDALKATGDPVAFGEMQKMLALRALADPTPPTWSQWWWGSHPTVLERLALTG